LFSFFSPFLHSAIEEKRNYFVLPKGRTSAAAANIDNRDERWPSDKIVFLFFISKRLKNRRKSGAQRPSYWVSTPQHQQQQQQQRRAIFYQKDERAHSH
jgi:hypothetical protein